jgi:hypothetical protein
MRKFLRIFSLLCVLTLLLSACDLNPGQLPALAGDEYG